MGSIHDTEYCRKVLMREFERLFPDLTLDRVTAAEYESEKQKMHAWTLETLIWTCARIAEGTAKREALRGYAQAREYRGRNGGFWPSSTISDASITIQNALEDLISPR